MFKKIYVGLLLGCSLNLLSSDYTEEDRGVEESKDGACEPKYFKPNNGCAPLDFLAANEARVRKLSEYQQAVLADVIFNCDQSRAKSLPVDIRQRLVSWGHLEGSDDLCKSLSLLKQKTLHLDITSVKSLSDVLEKLS